MACYLDVYHLYIKLCLYFQDMTAYCLLIGLRRGQEKLMKGWCLVTNEKRKNLVSNTLKSLTVKFETKSCLGLLFSSHL